MENGPASHRPQWSAQADGVMHCEYPYTSDAMCKSMHTHAHRASHLRQVSHSLAYGQALIVDGTSTPGGQTIANIHTHAMQHANPCLLMHSGAPHLRQVHCGLVYVHTLIQNIHWRWSINRVRIGWPLIRISEEIEGVG